MARHDPRQARFGPDLYAHATAYWLPSARWPKRYRWAPARTLRRRQGRAIRRRQREFLAAEAAEVKLLHIGPAPAEWSALAVIIARVADAVRAVGLGLAAAIERERQARTITGETA
jgi:hypothetical protein